MFKIKDFIEIEYLGKTTEGKIFDTNIVEEAKKINAEKVAAISIICLGQNMILPAIDEFLIGKEPGKYVLPLATEKAFGRRNPAMIKIMPMAVFQKQQIYPQQGMLFSFDNAIGKISAVSGGRVIVDFNNPLAGKDVIYEINAKRVVQDVKEKVKSLMLAFFNQELEFSIEHKKLIIKAGKLGQFVEFFKDKFKELLDLDLEVHQESKEVKKEENLTSA